MTQGSRKSKSKWVANTHNEILLIKACERFFPWDRPHGEVGEGWNRVIEDINSNCDPGITVATAKLKIIELFEEFKNMQSSNEFNSGLVVLETSVQAHIANLYERYCRYKEGKQAKRKEIEIIAERSKKNKLVGGWIENY